MNEAMWEDLFYGFVYGLASVGILHYAAVGVAFACAALWMLGGIGWLGWNGWRRVVMPVVMCGVFVAVHHSGWPLLSFGLQWGALSVGYGLPGPEDKGSALGRRFGKWARPIWFGILATAMVPIFF